MTSEKKKKKKRRAKQGFLESCGLGWHSQGKQAQVLGSLSVQAALGQILPNPNASVRGDVGSVEMRALGLGLRKDESQGLQSLPVLAGPGR